MIWFQNILKDVELADSNCLKVFFDILNCLGDMAKNLEGLFSIILPLGLWLKNTLKTKYLYTEVIYSALEFL